VPSVKLSSKGQITIPKAVRERLRLRSGGRVSWKVTSDGTVTLIARNRPISAVIALLAGKGNGKRISIADMNPGSFDDGSL
jgi:AbrB family looped-hinge helix DNA binding protein